MLKIHKRIWDIQWFSFCSFGNLYKQLMGTGTTVLLQKTLRGFRIYSVHGPKLSHNSEETALRWFSPNCWKEFTKILKLAVYRLDALNFEHLSLVQKITNSAKSTLLHLLSCFRNLVQEWVYLVWHVNSDVKFKFVHINIFSGGWSI